MKRPYISLLFVLFLLLSATSLEAVVFRWAVEKDAAYRVLSYVNEQRFLNGRYHSTIEIRNKAVLKTIAVSSNGQSGLYKGEFQYFEREVGHTNEPFALKEVYPSEFWRDRLGKYTIDRDYFMPVVRDVPIFPEKDIAPGEMWQADAHEVHDLKEYGLTSAYRIPIKARYIYVGDRVIEGRRLALFSITYVFSHYGDIDLDQYVTRANQDLAKYRNDPARHATLRQRYEYQLERMRRAPQRINGSCIQLYYWDIEKGLPVSMNEDFHFIFHLLNGEVHEFKGISSAAFERIKPVGEKEADRITDTLKGREGDGITVKRDKRGIVVELGDILFDTDKFTLKPDARATLMGLAERIKQSGKFEIRVEGHTDNTGDPGYNLDLSRKRANVVANFLTKAMGTDPRSISWIGYGMSRPAADNRTISGRAKNRRVEIILLTQE